MNPESYAKSSSVAAEAAEFQPSAPAANQLVKQLAGFVIAAGLLWLAFRDVNMGQLWQHMQKINLFWAGAVCVSSIVSHFLRAARWKIMLQPLADRSVDRPAGPVSLWNAFCAVMICYAVNIPIPRGGEVARVVSICKSERLQWAGVLPTLLIDRLLDIAMLVLMVGLSLVLMPPDIKSKIHGLEVPGALMCVAVVAGLLLLPKLGGILRFIADLKQVEMRLSAKHKQTISGLIEQFDQGTAFMRNPAAFPKIGMATFLMWGCYWLNMYLMLYAFGLEKVVTPLRSLMVFTMGSISVIAPTPGCAGTYHLATSKALSMVAGLDPTEALAFATLLHAVSFVFIVCLVAAICFLIQSLIRKREVG